MISSRPILFNGPMVRALLAGTKTQTRRIMKVQPTNESYRMWQTLSTTGDRRNVGRFHWVKTEGEPERIVDEGPYFHCPYGQPGDQLWVREIWRSGLSLDKWSPKQIAAAAIDAGYRKHWAPIQFEAGESVNEYVHTLRDFGGKWGKKRASIHMPSWASRITLEITGVRVERLQAISNADAKAEGVSKNQCPDWHAISDYLVLWESLNGPGSWALNPWVWVIEFKLVGQ